jgi:IS30 family transposase
MARTGRPGFIAEEKETTWVLWRQGVSFSEIGRVINKEPGSVFGVIRLQGGITPVPKVAKEISLSVDDREFISRGLAAGESFRSIAKALKRAPSTISREVNNSGGRIEYRAVKAEENALDSRGRPKTHKLENVRLNRLVVNKLHCDWSPEQISGWLKAKFPTVDKMNVSHETIYRSLFIPSTRRI